MRRVALLLAVLAAACSGEDAPTPTYHPTDNPEWLSAWGMAAVRGEELRLAETVAPYDLATPLFSDYAQKLRTVWMPDGVQAEYSPDAAFAFPVGTVITKTFYYPATADGIVAQTPEILPGADALSLSGVRLVETRVLVRRKEGWTALPYVWNDTQTDARLERTGAIVPMTLIRADGRAETFVYSVPNANQCAACHATNATTKAVKPIGLKARHLNKRSSFHPAFNQLDAWIAAGRLAAPKNAADAPANADWSDGAAPLDARARAYLDINCSHCHNPAGAADTSGLNLEPDASGAALGVCKTPIAAGGGTGGRPFGIVPGEPDRSITLYRLESTDPGAMMPELGRALAHEEGVALIRDWIAGMDGACG